MGNIGAIASKPSKPGRVVTSRILAKGFYACSNSGDTQQDIPMNGQESVSSKAVHVMNALDDKFNGKFNCQIGNDITQWVKDNNTDMKIKMNSRLSAWELHEGGSVRFRSSKGPQFVEWPDASDKAWVGVNGTKGTCKIGLDDRRTMVKNFQDYNKCVFQLKVKMKATNKPDMSDRCCVGTCFFAKVRLTGAPETPVLLTAAHCLMTRDPDGTIWEACDVTVAVTDSSGRHVKDWPFWRREWVVHDKYLQNSYACDGYDLGVIRLADEDLKFFTGCLGNGLHLAVDEQSAKSFSFAKSSVIVCGFPGDRIVKDGVQMRFSMWECSGAVIEETTSDFGHIKYDLDTSAGQSGGPVISESSKGNARLVTGVHVAGLSGDHNLGVKLTRAMLAWLKQNMR